MQYSTWEKPVQMLNILGELTIIPTILLNQFLLLFSVFKLTKEKKLHSFFITKFVHQYNDNRIDFYYQIITSKIYYLS